MGAKLDFGLKDKSRESYLGLVCVFPLATIQSDAHLAEAQKVMDRLLAKAPSPGCFGLASNSSQIARNGSQESSAKNFFSAGKPDPR